MSAVQGPVAVLGRVLLSAIFVLSALGEKLPHFGDVVSVMASAGIPAPQLMLVGAIVFLIVGGLSVAAGYQARFGAALLLTFLVLATYYFHPFWKLAGPAQQTEMIQFMKNLSMMGAMLLIIAHGSGPMSLDSWMHNRTNSSANDLQHFSGAKAA